MIINIDFNSEEAFYMQLRNQIILGIAMSEIQNGDQLPPVRQMAELVGINMHTVNKAYAVLRQEGFVKLDRRKGAIICIDIDRLQTIAELRSDFAVILAKAVCKGISRDEVHELVDQVLDMYE